MNSRCVVSVCVPVYNVRNYIRRCAESLFGQSQTDGVEFIFVDDASPDDSIGILRCVLDEFPLVKPHVRILRHDVNRGLAAARRTAVEAARGEFVAHVDSDDWVEAGYLERLLSVVNPSVDVVVADVIDETSHGSCVRKNHLSANPQDWLLDKIEDRTSSYMHTKLIRTCLYGAHPEVFAPDDVFYLEDYFSMLRIFFFARKIVYLPEALYHYNLSHSQSITHCKKRGHMASAVLCHQLSLDFALAHDFPVDCLDALARSRVSCKARVLLDCPDLAVHKEFADVFRNEELERLGCLSMGGKLMILLVHFHLWPLVSFYLAYIALRRKFS